MVAAVICLMGGAMHSYMDKLARFFALLGGTVLTILIVETCLSIVGRSLNSFLHGDLMQSIAPGAASALLATGVGPITGDFELVEAGMAFVIFAFLPLCHLNEGHASVDVFTERLPVRINKILRMVIEIIFALVISTIAWQLLQGTLSKQSSGQTTFLLQFPVWWAYALSLSGAVATAIVACYMAAMHIIEMVTGQRILPANTGAEH